MSTRLSRSGFSRRLKSLWRAVVCVLTGALLTGACTRERIPPAREAGSKTLRVLFIGNSYTYRNDLPGLVEQLSSSARSSPPVEAGLMAALGASLESHWKNGRALQVIREGKWDAVVLQEQSLAPLRDKQSFFQYARLFDAEIKKAGARTLIFFTWARRSAPESQAQLNQAYREITHELGAEAAPVGVAWQQVRQGNTQISLYAFDGSHPSRRGAYLAACVFWAVLYRQSPVGLPALGMSAAEAELLQKAAWQAVTAESF